MLSFEAYCLLATVPLVFVFCAADLVRLYSPPGFWPRVRQRAQDRMMRAIARHEQRRRVWRLAHPAPPGDDRQDA